MSCSTQIVLDLSGTKPRMRGILSELAAQSLVLSDIGMTLDPEGDRFDWIFPSDDQVDPTLWNLEKRGLWGAQLTDSSAGGELTLVVSRQDLKAWIEVLAEGPRDPHWRRAADSGWALGIAKRVAEALAVQPLSVTLTILQP